MTLFDVPDRPGIAATIFEAIARENVLVDMIVQSIGRDDLADVSFTVPRKELEHSLSVRQEARGGARRRSEGRAGRGDPHRERHRHPQPHGRRPADVQGARRGEDQRRDGQHERSPRERGRRARTRARRGWRR